MDDLERTAKAIARRHKTRKAAFEQAESERDEFIRGAGRALTAARLAGIFGLSEVRVKQIRRGVRV